MRSSRWLGSAAISGGALLAAAALCQEVAGRLAGRVEFADLHNPPPWLPVPAATMRDFNLGREIFNAQWLPAQSAAAAGNQGLGPLFIETSCDACHDDGARGRPPASPGEMSHSFVMQLGGPSTDYGHVLNTRAIEGHAPEGRIVVTRHQRIGRYPDGRAWTLREPRYVIEPAAPGVLTSRTVLKPRIGPALFGVGLLDAVPQSAIDAIREAQSRRVRGSTAGRFGWQGDAVSLVDQTAIAFSREMGLTTDQLPSDDCTPAQTACLAARGAGSPEVSERNFHAVNTFQFLLAAAPRATLEPAVDAAGAKLFEQVGCAECHTPHLPVPSDSGAIRIDPYSDLLLHDLGEGLADRTVDGMAVPSRWRTAPLWGLSHALRAGPVGLLHDGRAGSIEEAILWHEGQGSDSRRRFMALDAARRQQLLDWVATL